jgi:hypothetical protein
MSLLSSTTLFNFTDSFEHLESNLLKGIYAGTIYEKLPNKNNGYAVNMACFCDIPLSLIKEHLSWYGNFGIGLSRTYAREHGVSPVFYIHSDSNILKSLITDKSDFRLRLFPYVKQFIGNQRFINDKIKKKKFYDEHEWRYIPPENNFQLFLKTSRQNAEIKMEKKVSYMPINYEKIEYLIIESSDYVDSLIKVINAICKKNKSLNREHLISRIITAKQIRRDF